MSAVGFVHVLVIDDENMDSSRRMRDALNLTLERTEAFVQLAATLEVGELDLRARLVGKRERGRLVTWLERLGRGWIDVPAWRVTC